MRNRTNTMHDENTIAMKTAASLLQINAIKINVKNPFTWVSGIKSPVYCDNRQILSYPDIRTAIAADLAAIVSREFPSCQVIAGVATGAIAHGILVAEKLNKPFVYVRNAAKGHGLTNRIEGRLQAGERVVVIEDLVSTGLSSLKAVKTIRDAGCEVLGMAAIFSYELPQAIKAMEQYQCALFPLSNFSSLLQQVNLANRLTADEEKILRDWRLNPEKYYQ
jgi:orotate phosphoribosyltransferase